MDVRACPGECSGPGGDTELSSPFWKAVLAGRGEEVTDDKKGD